MLCGVKERQKPELKDGSRFPLTTFDYTDPWWPLKDSFFDRGAYLPFAVCLNIISPGRNPFTMCMYIKSPHGTLKISYNFICQLHLDKARRKKHDITTNKYPIDVPVFTRDKGV